MGTNFFLVKIYKDLLMTLDNIFKPECTGAVVKRSQEFSRKFCRKTLDRIPTPP